VKGAVGNGVVNVDDQLSISGQLISEQCLDAARRVEQIAVVRDTRQLRQRTCHVRHDLPRSHHNAILSSIIPKIAIFSQLRSDLQCQISRLSGQCIAPAGRKTHFWTTE